MGKFFEHLISENKYCEWAATLDWLFDDLKFSSERNWNGGYVGSFTRKIKKLKYLSDNSNSVWHGKVQVKDFPNQNKTRKKAKENCIIMKAGDSFARDLVRHIRNGIAHGQATITNSKCELYIEIIDYSDKSKSADKQTAYIYIPMEYITTFYKIYSEINNSIMNTKEKDRSDTKKKKKEKK